MPLQDELPVIDDRRYSDLVDEARTRIPRYASEWTDVNENEPGMAIIELFAWMSELLLFRLGKVPKLNYIKFLALLGIDLTPASPAKAGITFPVQTTYAGPYVIVPLHTQVETEEPDEQGSSIVFETERSLIALTAALDAVQYYNGSTYQDLTTANTDGTDGFYPFGSSASPGSALLLGFASTQEFPAVEVDLMVWVATAQPGAMLFARCGERVTPPATIAWEYWNGKDWYPLALLKDDTAAFSRSGHIYFNAPVEGSMVAATLGKVTGARYWLRGRLASSSYQRAPRLTAVRTNTVDCIQAQTIDEEVLGGSNGLPDQVFRVTNTPVLEGTLVLVVDEGDGEVKWKEADDFYASGPDDTQYLLDRSTGEIRFGSGRQGRIPVANAKRPSNVIARTYRFGGGKRGNVTSGKLTSLVGSLDGIDAAGVTNLFAAAGGGDEESLDSAKLRVPQTIKSHERAVTVEDFEMHARAAGGIARAKALALYHPRFPGVPVPGVVSVIVVPEAIDENDTAPMPSESTLQAVCAYLDERRLATVETFVLAPRYLEIVVRAELVSKDDADLAEVNQLALDAMKMYFHPLYGGDDSTTTKQGSGWPFGGDVYYSLVLQRLMVTGVKRIASLEIEVHGASYPACTDVTVEDNVLLKNGTHEISTRYDET
jgi:hypothetical protein